MNRLKDEAFLELALGNKFNAEILRRLPVLNLDQCYLTAGCLFQTAWNLRSGKLPAADIRDYDIFYFDASDLSSEAEAALNERGRQLFQDLAITIELKNQARVHTWYPAYFGSSCPELSSSRDGINRFLVECTCVGIEVATGRLYAPYGLDDIWAGTLKINPLHRARPDLFRRKAESYRARWQWLSIVECGWPAETSDAPKRSSR